MESKIKIKKGLTGVWVTENRDHLGMFSISTLSRRVSWMTKELKAAALLEGRWVDCKITVRFRRGGKTSQDL